MSSAPDYAPLFHRLNNQLGVLLANAELLEARCADEASRARAAQIVASAVEAIDTARALRLHLDEGQPGPPAHH
jgi:hypothetical protein